MSGFAKYICLILTTTYFQDEQTYKLSYHISNQNYEREANRSKKQQ